MADGIDVKAEGRKLINRQQQGMRNTASDENYARNYRNTRGTDKKTAENRMMLNFYEQPSRERTRNIQRDEYTMNSFADKRKSSKKRAAKVRSSGR